MKEKTVPHLVTAAVNAFYTRQSAIRPPQLDPASKHHASHHYSPSSPLAGPSTLHPPMEDFEYDNIDVDPGVESMLVCNQPCTRCVWIGRNHPDEDYNDSGDEEGSEGIDDKDQDDFDVGDENGFR